MKNKMKMLTLLFTFSLVIFNFQNVFAHEGVTVGDYDLEIGWLTEPPITGQMNGIIVNVTTGDEKPVEDVSNLTVSVLYAGQSKALILQPLSEDTHGQFIAPILPAAQGQYTVHLGGKLGDTDVSADVDVEEVRSPVGIQFPIVDASSQSSGPGLTGWLSIFGIVFGLAGTIMGGMALRKKN